MIPVLFKGNETNFNHNGIGLLKDTLSCEVTEVRNGSFDLELVYPITGPYFKDLKNGNIIQAKPNDTDPPHNFRIQEIDKTLSDKEVVVYAVSRTNDLGGNLVKSLYLEDVTPQVIFNEMKKVLHYPTTFNFVSNITTIGSVDWQLNNPLNLIVGEEGSLVDIFGGEVKRTNDTIFLYGRRGKDNVTTIRAGKNLDGFKMTESFQGKYTQILPYFKYEEEVQGEVPVEGESYAETERQEVTIFGSIVSSPYHGRYPVNAIRPIDFSQNEYVREAKTLEALNAEASRYFNDLYSEIDKPSVSINVDMVQLVDSEQYELYERLEKKELTDTVSVYVPEYDVDVLVKITELKYDSLRERTISIVAGSSGRTSLMDEISGSYKQFTTNLVNDKIQSATAGIVNQVLTTKTGVNMYAGRATPPDSAKPGDIWFKDVGGGDVELYEFDGVNWVRKMYKGFGEDVRRMVDEKIDESNAAFTQALGEHDKVIDQALTRAGQANDLAQQAKTDAGNASLSASRANQEAQQARTEAASAKESALSAITKADNARNELLGRVNTLDAKATNLTNKANDLQNLSTQLNTKATNLQNQANDISNRLSTLSTETGTKFQNQSRQLTDLQGNITGIEERISKQRVGSRNLLLGTRENTGNGWTHTGEEYLGVKVARRQDAWLGLINPVKVYAGHEYIFSYYYKLSTDAAGQLITYFTKLGNHPDKTLAGYSYLSGRSLSITDNKDKWLLHTTKIKVTSDGWLWPRVEKSTGTGYLYIGPRQFEEGNVPTQWHPNEEDVSEEEMVYRRGIEGTLSQYSSTIQNINGTVTNHTSQLTQQANQIASKVSQTEFNTEKTKIGNMQTTITQQANQIALKAEKTSVDNIKRTVDSNTTSITQQADQIALKADSTTVNNLTGRMEATETIIGIQAESIRTKVSKTEFDAEKRKIGDMQTSITQQASQIALKANQTDLNNLTGRMSTAESSITQVPNKIALAVEEVTAKIPTSAGNKNYLGVSKVVNRASNNFAYNESTGIWSMTVPANTDMHGKGVYFDTRGNTVMLNGGETLFVGLTVMVNKATQFNFDINNRLHVNHTGGNDHDDRPKSVIFPKNRTLQPNVWTRVYLMYTAKPTTPIWDDGTNFGLLNRTEDVHLQIKEVTMAKSNIPVDYQKADMDIDQTMSNLKTSIDQTSREIALKANSTELNAVSNRLTTAEGTIRTQAGLIELKASKTDLTPIQNSLNTKVDINQVNSAIAVGTQGIRQEVTAVKGVLEGGISARNYAVGTATPSVHSVDSRTATVTNGYVVKQLYSTHQNRTLRDLGFKVGDKYTVVFDIYAENKTAFRDYRVAGYHTGHSHLVGSVTNTIGTPSSPTQFVGTATITADAHLTTYRWMIRFDLSHLNVTVKNFRIFKGEIKQDWYPAWEDQEAALEATKARVDITERSITSLVTGAKTLPDGRNSVFATKIESLEGAINQRVTTQELNDKGYQTASQVNTAITSKGYQTASDVTNIVDGKLPTNMGGRNLVRGSAELKAGGQWSTGTWRNSGAGGRTEYNVTLPSSPIKGVTKGARLYSTDTQQWGICQDGTVIGPGVYTFSVWVKGTAGLKIRISSAYSQDSNNPYNSGHKDFTLSNSEWTRISQTFTIDKFYNNISLAYFLVITPGDAYFAAPYVHMSSIPGDWSPAPEDHDATLTDRLAGYVTNQTYTTYTADRQQTDRQITEQINQTVSKVPTGPVNLVVNGFDPQALDPWRKWHNDWTLELTTHSLFYNGTKKLLRFKTSTSTTKGTFESNVYNLKRNTKYTIRVGIFANTNCKELRFCFGRGTSATSINDWAQAHPFFVGNASRLEYKTITVDSGNFDYGKLTFDHNGTKTVGQWADMYIAEVSIIEGEFNNSWTPSFDELITEQKFNETKSTVDAFSRAIGTRVEGNIIPNIARLVMTQDTVVSEVAKYGEHNNNLVQDAEKFSTTKGVGGATPNNYMPCRVSWRKTGATSNSWAGIDIPVNVKRFIPGEKYTISFDYYFYNAPDSNVAFSMKDHNNDVSYFGASLGGPTTPVGVFHHFERTFTVATGTANNTTMQGLYFYGQVNSNVAIKDVMLVRGEKIGPFSTSQVDTAITRVEQTANSYAIKFLNSANDITSQLNMTNSTTRIKSSLIHLDSEVTVTGKSWMSGAVIKDLSADKITAGTLDAEKVRITNLQVKDVSGIDSAFLKSVIGTAFIDWMKGKLITSQNNNTVFNLERGTLTFGSNHTGIYRYSDPSNPIYSESGMFFLQDRVNVNGISRGLSRIVIGAERRGGDVNVNWYKGGFNGIILETIRGVNTADHDMADRVSIIGDRIDFKHTYVTDENNPQPHDYATGWRMNNYMLTSGNAIELRPININPRNSNIKAGDFFLYNGHNNGEWLRVILERILHNTQELSNRTGGRGNIFWDLDAVMNNRTG